MSRDSDRKAMYDMLSSWKQNTANISSEQHDNLVEVLLDAGFSAENIKNTGFNLNEPNDKREHFNNRLQIAIKEYRVNFPSPHPLSANLELAFKASMFTKDSAERDALKKELKEVIGDYGRVMGDIELPLSLYLATQLIDIDE